MGFCSFLEVIFLNLIKRSMIIVLDFSVGLLKKLRNRYPIVFCEKGRFLALSLCYLLQLWETKEMFYWICRVVIHVRKGNCSYDYAMFKTYDTTEKKKVLSESSCTIKVVALEMYSCNWRPKRKLFSRTWFNLHR